MFHESGKVHSRNARPIVIRSSVDSRFQWQGRSMKIFPPQSAWNAYKIFAESAQLKHEPLSAQRRSTKQNIIRTRYVSEVEKIFAFSSLANMSCGIENNGVQYDL